MKNEMPKNECIDKYSSCREDFYCEEFEKIKKDFISKLDDLQERIFIEVSENEKLVTAPLKYENLFDDITEIYQFITKSKYNKHTFVLITDFVDFSELEECVLWLVARGMNVKEICKILDYGDSIIRKTISRIVKRIVSKENKKYNVHFFNFLRLTLDNLDFNSNNYTIVDLKNILNIDLLNLNEEQMLLLEKLHKSSIMVLAKFMNDAKTLENVKRAEAFKKIISVLEYRQQKINRN